MAPEPVPGSGSLGKGVHVIPPSIEYAPRLPASPLLPTRATISGLLHATSMSVPPPKIGLSNMPLAGAAFKSS